LQSHCPDNPKILVFVRIALFIAAIPSLSNRWRWLGRSPSVYPEKPRSANRRTRHFNGTKKNFLCRYFSCINSTIPAPVSVRLFSEMSTFFTKPWLCDLRSYINGEEQYEVKVSGTCTDDVNACSVGPG